MEPMSGRRPQGLSSCRGIHGKRLLYICNSAATDGGYEQWQVVTESRRSGGLVHGRDGAKKSRLCQAAEDANSGDKPKGRRSRTGTPVNEKITKWLCRSWQDTGSTNKWNLCYCGTSSRRWQLIWQDPRVGFTAETGIYDTIAALWSPSICVFHFFFSFAYFFIFACCGFL